MMEPFQRSKAQAWMLFPHGKELFSSPKGPKVAMLLHDGCALHSCGFATLCGERLKTAETQNRELRGRTKIFSRTMVATRRKGQTETQKVFAPCTQAVSPSTLQKAKILQKKEKSYPTRIPVFHISVSLPDGIKLHKCLGACSLAASDSSNSFAKNCFGYT